MSQKILVIGIVAGVLVVILIFVSFNSMKNVNRNDSNKPPLLASQGVPLRSQRELRASFAIFTNGTFRIFTDSRYHNKSSDVYIEGPDAPNIVFIKKNGITWGDFFGTLPMTLTKDCLITGTQQRFCTDETGSL